MTESKNELIKYLESIIDSIKCDEWDVDSCSIDMENDIDEWATKINGKSIDINIELKPQCKFEFKPIGLSDDILDIVRYAPYTTYTPSIYSCLNDNPYHRRCNQLEKHLKKNGIDCDVSRSSVGSQTFYKLGFEMDKTDNATSDWNIKKLLDIKNVGLVEFNKIDGIIYKTILIDEKELHDKYLCCDDLKF